MPKNFSQIVESKSNIIRGMINDNKTDTQIINELKMPVQTFYSYKKRIQKQDAQIWEKVHLDSAKYRATKLIQSLEECFYINRQIAINEKEQAKDRIEASRTMCEAAANIFKLVNEGPTFRVSLPISSDTVNLSDPKNIGA
jgi:hypothetical protein